MTNQLVTDPAVRILYKDNLQKGNITELVDKMGGDVKEYRVLVQEKDIIIEQQQVWGIYIICMMLWMQDDMNDAQ